MNLSDDIVISGSSLFIKSHKALVLSDLHIGLDNALNKNGLLIPRFHYEDLFKETQRLIKKFKPKIVVLNGDIKHDFSSILFEESKRVKEYINFLRRKSEVVLIKGNHDSILKPIADKLGLRIHNFFVLGNYFICHGDKVFDVKKSKTIIIGHQHPAISLREGPRIEKYKCFLLGKYERKNLIVVPPMNPLSEGLDILSNNILSPYLKEANLNNFKVFIVEEDKVYDFGLLKNINKLNK